MPALHSLDELIARKAAESADQLRAAAPELGHQAPAVEGRQA
jgi:hypothetical protein